MLRAMAVGRERGLMTCSTERPAALRTPGAGENHRESSEEATAVVQTKMAVGKKMAGWRWTIVAMFRVHSEGGASCLGDGLEVESEETEGDTQVFNLDYGVAITKM